MNARGWVVGGLLAAIFLATAVPAGAAPGLVKLGDFDSPVYVASPPGDASRVFVVEQTGRVQLLVDGVRRPTPFLDVSGDVLAGGERGLLSMAFAPDYSASGRFWIYLTVTSAASTNGTAGQIQVREYRRGADADHAAPAPVKRLLAIDHDAAANHNGGQLQVGPDGMLWVGTGDGGGANNDAVPGSAQDTASLLGKLLRIDPGGSPYGIPAGNPFAGGGGDPAVWASGLRNPWRFSFDPATGDLVIGDVGQGRIEEVDWATAPGRGRAANYGWPCLEGSLANNACAAPGAVGPVLEKTHSGDGYCAIVGGYVVRDPGLPTLAGRYLYGDNCSAPLRSVALADAGSDAPTGVAVSGLSSFGEDACGHLFAASLAGPVYRIQDGPLSARASRHGDVRRDGQRPDVRRRAGAHAAREPHGRRAPQPARAPQPPHHGEAAPCAAAPPLRPADAAGARTRLGRAGAARHAPRAATALTKKGGRAIVAIARPPCESFRGLFREPTAERPEVLYALQTRT